MITRELVHQSILPFEGEILREIVKSLSPRMLFESGTNNGYSTGWILAGIKDSGNLESTFYSCDPRRFPSEENLPKECWQGKYYSEQSNFLFLKEDSIKFLVRNQDKKFDFAFLDGDHRKQIVYEELKRLRIGEGKTIVFLHDIRPNMEVKEKDPYWGLMEYIEEDCKSNYGLFNLITPGSLATNLDTNQLGKILGSYELDFSTSIISLKEVVSRFMSLKK